MLRVEVSEVIDGHERLKLRAIDGRTDDEDVAPGLHKRALIRNNMAEENIVLVAETGAKAETPKPGRIGIGARDCCTHNQGEDKHPQRPNIVPAARECR